MATLAEVVVAFGFKDEKEFHSLVAAVDISSPKLNAAFKLWQFGDGTKAGLLNLKKKPK